MFVLSSAISFAIALNSFVFTVNNSDNKISNKKLVSDTTSVLVITGDGGKNVQKMNQSLLLLVVWNKMLLLLFQKQILPSILLFTNCIILTWTCS